ncbi:uncharacterized protein [Oryza sativa Japonica Group]|uniref:uncharacterized protein n=1 Tax=Oryza sativa subsp. japonica TaxID=39947 RepID=UPI00339C877E
MRKIIYPCADCKNEIAWDFDDAFKVKEHLVTRGFMDKYEIWTRHGKEQVDGPESVVPTQVEDMVHDDSSVEDKIDLEEMLRHAEPEVLMGSARGLNNFESLQKAAKEVLYDESKGCDSEFTTLRSVLDLMRLKARHGWSDTSFDSLLELLQKMLPRPNSLPSSTYQAKKLICPLSLSVEKIHACVNHCILYRKEYASLDECPTCGASRYKSNSNTGLEPSEATEGRQRKIPQLVMWYLPVKDRIKRIYSNPRDAELMRWHEEGRKKDGMIRHPADALSGQIKGKTGCVICLNGTYYRYLPGSNKLVYMRHRRFLRTNHKYRKMKAEFDGTEETDPAPKPTSGEKVCAMTEKIVCEFGKMTKKPSKGTKRKKPEKNTKGGDSKKQDDMSQKVISLKELGNLRTFAHETQCQLEMCFPPSFFDMMEHLIVHIVPQMVALGPLYLHQMWSYERYMAVLKGYVRNRAHPEGSMVKGYSTEEVVECCIDYLKDGYAIGVPVPRHEGRLSGRGKKGKKRFVTHDHKSFQEAHFSVLHQFAIVEPYIDQHIELIRANNKGRSTEWIMKEHKRLFIDWLRDLDLPEGETTDEITMKRLACGPSTTVNSWQGYDINGYSFSTRARDNKTCTQNSNVRVEAIDEAGEKQSYFRFIEEIWEIDYGHTMQFPIFKCQWVKYPNGVNVDKFGLIVVDLASVGHKDDPWVLANRVAQVFYVKDPSNLKKDIVLPGKQKILGVDGVEDVEDYNQYDSMPLYSQFVQKIKNVQTSTQKTVKPYMRTDGVGKNVKG